ncbi:putative amidase [Marinobacterium lacunae]|uniref:Putative amidase n=1 Tax=Marinobacterium lacunae TaxID=1232683 RepID=A0A081G0Z1_9GAMM|nr:amidase [Marinobacterium lacunae]KEA64446.1 putative amidase [Marinobacterium lacunae]
MTIAVETASACALVQAMRDGSLTPEKVVGHFIGVCERRRDIAAWREFAPTLARRAAGKLRSVSAPGLLHGIPVGIKDIMLTHDMPTRYGSLLYDYGVTGDDAYCVEQLRTAGAVILGKTVTTEFAYFAPGPTRNPHNLEHTPGGSSSGSAAAVAAGMVPIALGSQTAGSLIRPASYCGVFALKPGFGVIPTHGVKEMSPSLDTLGWLSRHAEDLELVRCALTNIEFQGLPAVTGARIGICRTHEWSHLNAGGRAAFERAVSLLGDAGLECVEWTMPDRYRDLVVAQQTIQAFEASRAYAAEWSMDQTLISPQFRELIKTGLSISSGEYRTALHLAGDARAEINDRLGSLDALLTPSAPGEAPSGLTATGDPVCSRIWTLLGHPNVNVPGLTGPNGLPIGVQLVGPFGGERSLVALADHIHPLLCAGNSYA